jgi:uncharacterized protein involved in exopolysaccharide biosynthesis
MVGQRPHTELNLLDDVRAWSALCISQWRLMSVIGISALTMVLIVVLLWPRSYESTMKFLVRDARQDLVVNPGGSAPQYRAGVSEETLNSEIELLRSRDLLVMVVNRMNLSRPEGDEDAALATERAVQALRRTLDVQVLRKTDLIQVQYSSRQPDHAAAVLRNLADGYLARHLAVHSNPGAYQFFREQAIAAKHDLQVAEDDLAKVARAENLVSPEEQKSAALVAANAIETELISVRAQRHETESTLWSARRQEHGVSQRVVTQERTAPYQGAVERLQTMLTELKNKRTELLTKFKDTDRTIAELNQQIADTSTDLDQAVRSTAREQSTDLNTHWQALQSEIISAQLRLAGLEAKERELRRQLKEYRGRAVDLAAMAPTYERLQLTVNDARSRYDLYLKREEEARVAEALDLQKISNVVLAEAPVPSHLPSGPNRRLAILAGGVGASLLALGVAIVAERVGWRARLPRARDIGSHVVGRTAPAEASGI